MKKNFKKIITLTAIFMSIFSCSFKADIKKYQDKTPKLNIIEYFSGKTEAYGMLQNRSGEVTRRFKVEMFGSQKDGEFVLEEQFIFDDGEKQERIWKVQMIDENNFTAKAGDVIGKSVGKQYGNAIEMDYVLRIPYKNSTIDVKINDWMYLIDEKSLINVSQIKKFGFVVGKLTIGFNKL